MLTWGATGGAALTAAAGTAWWASRPSAVTTPPAGPALAQPAVHASRDGTLALTLTVAPVHTRVAGRLATLWGYNASVPGPTLRVRPGDVVRVRLVNRLEEPTNLHVHGLHVSPEGHGDNVFVSVAPGAAFDYEFRLPTDHPSGTFWYYPHHHGMVADQVFAGMYGAIVVEDTTPVPAARERTLVISDITLGADGHPQRPTATARMAGRIGETVLVNGQTVPRLRSTVGERERWRIVNACASRYLRIPLPGALLLGMDGHYTTHATPVSELLLAPANRADVLVDAHSGTVTVHAAPYHAAGMGGMMGQPQAADTALFTWQASGPAVAPPRPPGILTHVRDLRGEPIAARRGMDFGMGMGGSGGTGGSGGMAFVINGRPFDPARTDQTVALGRVEEWTFTNSTPMDHPVHLHVWPMQILEDGTGPASIPRWQDTVNLPAGGRVRVLIAFDDFPGRTVYHCHILDHEDAGMMATVQAS